MRSFFSGKIFREWIYSRVLSKILVSSMSSISRGDVTDPSIGTR